MTELNMGRRPILAGLSFAAFGCGPAAAGPAPAALVGDWTGVLETGGPQLRLKLVLASEGTVNLFSLDQGGAAIPGRAERLDPENIALIFSPIGGRFQGRLEGDALVGTWSQGGGKLALTLKRGAENFTAPPAEPLTVEKLKALRTAAGSPALAVAARRGVGPTLEWVDGLRAAGAPAPAAVGDLWHLGSITKSMTATLVAVLAEKGAISWDDTVGQSFRPSAYDAATYRHLLSHRAGLQANIPGPELLAYPRQEADARASRQKFALKALSQKPAHALGTAELYSNNGYVIAGAMLESKLGAPWETLIQEHLFKPLGIASAGFGAPGTARLADQPVGHAKAMLSDKRTPYWPDGKVTDNPAVLGPAGRVHMRLSDVLVYLAAHRDRGVLLKPESWAILHTPPFGGSYAMGWEVRSDGSLWHNGSNTLWYAEVSVDPGKGVVAVAAVNDGHIPSSAPAVSSALRGIAAAV
jgi:CubicO group peptidase (beta-lactamase class C family)